MTTPVGYPDYTRLSRAGQQQLFFTTSNVTNGQKLFQGYVGSWPFTVIFALFQGSTDFIRIEMIYFSDSTFTTQCGFRFAVRTGAQFSAICYGNMSDWLLVQVHTQSTNPMPTFEFGIYATTQYTPNIGMDSMDVPLIFMRSTVAATSTVELLIAHVRPGNARYLINSAATSWQWKLRYYDWNTNTITTCAQSQTFGVPTTVEGDAPMIDAPMYIDLINNDAAARLFLGSLLTDG